MNNKALKPTTVSQPASGVSHIHESARAQVAGAAHYVDDLPEVRGTLHAAPILSTVAHGTLRGVDILHDVGRSINPAIDIGQIEGGFVQGMGWLTTEQLVWNDQGFLITHAPSTYKIPTAGDVPDHFKIDLWPEPNREDNVFGSKAVGEPPFMLAISVFEALRDAVAQARGDGQAVQLQAPATAEQVLNALG
jgi:xanthine dehydrogenase molybdopterin-binding subunit B